MSLQLNLDQIFPVKDAESARLAMLKANYLEAINVIDAAERHLCAGTCDARYVLPRTSR